MTTLPIDGAGHRPDKYVVFKRDDWRRMTNALRLEVAGEIVDDMDQTQLPDCTVIRAQDIFAAPALHGYANAISVAAVMSPIREQHDHLLKLADLFHERAMESEQWDWRRVPD